MAPQPPPDAAGDTTILVVEDDRAVRDSLERALRMEGYAVQTANDGAKGLEAAQGAGIDLIVLDRTMPYIDGLTMCRELRHRGVDTPILMVTARTEVSDRVDGLDAGADDYLPKPFALDELLARVRALVRRRSGPAVEGVLSFADLRVDPQQRRAWRGQRELELTKTEFDLLELLVENAGIALDRSTIYERIWGYDFTTSSNNLDVYIGYLRRKTEAGGESRLVQTVRGIGYTVRE